MKKTQSEVEQFRKHFKKKGYELVDITHLCKFSLGCSGWCNDFNEPDQEIYHIKVKYRGEEICEFPDPNKNINKNYVVFFGFDDDITGRDFIIFRKVKIR